MFDKGLPFYFNPTQTISSSKRQQMLNAMAYWERIAHIDFIPWTNETNRVRIDDADVNNSYVGQKGGEQIINIFNWFSQHVLLHELAHCLGFWHEQSRPDRDNFISMNWLGIQNEEEHNFDRHDNSSTYGPYDFESIMHYDQYAFSVCHLLNIDSSDCTDAGFNQCNECILYIFGNPITIGPTISVLPPNTIYQNLIGTFRNPSILDSLTMSFLYPQLNWTFIDKEYTGLSGGSFLNPFINFNSIITTIGIPEGNQVFIQPGNYSSVGSYSKPITLNAPLGGVSLGQ